MSKQALKPGWRMVKFGDVVKQCKESVDRENNPFERYVEGGHMVTEDIHIRQWGEFGQDYVGPAFHRIFRKGQVLYGSRRTYLKKVAVAEFDGITANTTFVCETKNQKVFMQELLPFLMLSDEFTKHSIAESKGSTNPYINWPDIAKYEFPLPPIDEQKRMAEILWAADEAKEEYTSSANDLEKLLRVTRATTFKTLSEKYSCVSIADCGNWKSGGTPSKSNKDYWNGDTPWVSPKDMKVDVIHGSEDTVTSLGESNGTTLVPSGTILIVVRGMILAHTFPVAVTGRAVTFNQDMKAVIPNECFSSDYIYHWFKAQDRRILLAIEESTHGTKRLATDMLYRMKIPKADQESQKNALDSFAAVEDRIRTARLHAERVLNTSRAYINDLIGGER